MSRYHDVIAVTHAEISYATLRAFPAAVTAVTAIFPSQTTRHRQCQQRCERARIPAWQP